MKGTIVMAAAVLAVVALPVSAFAATYGYIAKTGEFKSVTANSAAEALRASDIAADSGVILLSGNTGLIFSAVPSVTIGTTTASTGTSTAATSSAMMVSTSSPQAATSTMMTGTSTMMVGTSTTTIAPSATSTIATSSSTTVPGQTSAY